MKGKYLAGFQPRDYTRQCPVCGTMFWDCFPIYYPADVTFEQMKIITHRAHKAYDDAHKWKWTLEREFAWLEGLVGQKSS